MDVVGVGRVKNNTGEAGWEDGEGRGRSGGGNKGWNGSAEGQDPASQTSKASPGSLTNSNNY